MWKVRGIAGHCHQVGCLAMNESREHACQGSGEIRHFVTVHGQAHRPVNLLIAVGIDCDDTDLWREPRDRVLRKWRALKGLQTLIHTAHASTPSAGEDQSRNVSF